MLTEKEQVEEEIYELTTKINALNMRLDGKIKQRNILINTTLDAKIAKCWDEAMDEGLPWATPRQVFDIAVKLMKVKGIINDEKDNLSSVFLNERS